MGEAPHIFQIEICAGLEEDQVWSSNVLPFLTGLPSNANGIGIFRKIQSALNFLDERQAILELSKGKLTTDPERHSGQGILFTSRMLDEFRILSGGAFFSHAAEDDRDFATLETIGQAFADEIFRVWAKAHPDVECFVIYATPAVRQMIAAISPAPNVRY